MDAEGNLQQVTEEPPWSWRSTIWRTLHIFNAPGVFEVAGRGIDDDQLKEMKLLQPPVGTQCKTH
jgi:hypothetical protein